MKRPPLLEPRLAPAPALDRTDPRFLAFVGLGLGAMAIGLKSELLTLKQAWALGMGLMLLAALAVVVYLRGEKQRPALEHYIPAVLGLVALTGLAFIVPEWWKYALAAGCFAGCFFLTGQFDLERLREHEKPGHIIVQEGVLGVVTVGAYLVILVILTSQALLLRLVAVFLITWLATYRSFRVVGRPIPRQRAFFFSLLVAQVVGFLAWAMSVYIGIEGREGLFAGMLLLAWYVNRGVIRNAVEETLTPRVVLEFGLLALFLAYLFFVNYQPPGT